MTIGARMFKTGLAVVLAIYVSGLFDFDSPFIVAAAAIFTIQPSIYRSWQQVLDRIQSTVIGAAFALAAAAWLGVSPISVGIVCVAVILFNIRIKTESAIGLTLVTVVAVMDAHAEGWTFALERLAMVMTGIVSAFLVNVLVLPPRPKKQFREQALEAHRSLSLLLRTAVANKMRRQVFKEEREKLEQTLRRLEEQYRLFGEERVMNRERRRDHARQLLVSRQMIRTLQQGAALLAAIDEHYFSSPGAAAWTERFDRHIDKLTDVHEQLLLMWEGKIKPGAAAGPRPAEDFTEELAAYLSAAPAERKRLLFVVSEMFEYAYQLNRLHLLLERVKRDGGADRRPAGGSGTGMPS